MDSLLKHLRKISLFSTEGFFVDLSNRKSLKDLITNVERVYDIDILVNNAGFGYMGEFHNMPQEKVDSMQEVNINAVVRLCHAFLPKMIKRPGSGILNVGSIASFFATPISSLYGATKYFILGFTDALHTEMLPFGVHVSGIYPGHTASRFIERASGGKKKNWEKAMPPEMVAALAIEGLYRNKMRVIPGLGNRMRFLASRILPAPLILNKIYSSAIINHRG